MTAPNDASLPSFAGLTGAYWLERPAHDDAECADCRQLIKPPPPRTSADVPVLRLLMLAAAGVTIAAALLVVAVGRG
ncbi:hypothetical protein [Streptomyces sp. NPDC054975]